MISKWIALACLGFFLLSLALGRIEGVWGVSGAIAALAAIMAIEVAVYRNKKWQADLEHRVNELDTKVTSLQNVDRLRTATLQARPR